MLIDGFYLLSFRPIMAIIINPSPVNAGGNIPPLYPRYNIHNAMNSRRMYANFFNVMMIYKA